MKPTKPSKPVLSKKARVVHPIFYKLKRKQDKYLAIYNDLITTNGSKSTRKELYNKIVGIEEEIQNLYLLSKLD